MSSVLRLEDYRSCCLRGNPNQIPPIRGTDCGHKAFRDCWLFLPAQGPHGFAPLMVIRPANARHASPQPTLAGPRGSRAGRQYCWRGGEAITDVRPRGSCAVRGFHAGHALRPSGPFHQKPMWLHFVARIHADPRRSERHTPYKGLCHTRTTHHYRRSPTRVLRSSARPTQVARLSRPCGSIPSESDVAELCGADHADPRRSERRV